MPRGVAPGTPGGSLLTGRHALKVDRQALF